MDIQYKIVQYFGPKSENWIAYISWKKTNLDSFDSVDGIFRPDLFLPKSERDWANCVNEEFKLHLITELNYAKEIISRYPNGNIVGVQPEIDNDHICEDGLSGYDIIDSHWYISLITTWEANADHSFCFSLMDNGLIGDLNQALQIRDFLHKKFPDVPHAKKCSVWAIYRIDI